MAVFQVLAYFVPDVARRRELARNPGRVIGFHFLSITPGTDIGPKRLREKVRNRTGRNRVGAGIREVIADLNPLLRGWGSYFRTGNAATRFIQADGCVWQRLHGLMVKKRGRNLHAGQAQVWTGEWFNGHGLYRLRGTIRYPKAA
jgi:RNA-directed DNA polymerase